MTGTVYLVGAGPGAPDLLTLRAARLLGEADVVFHDALVPDQILKLVRTSLKVPVGKRCGSHSTAQRFINKRLADAAKRYRTVVRLKGGDPMLFGRADEEIRFLKQQNIPVEVVPGITAAAAASAELGVSLTRRGVARSVVFATPRVGEGERASGWARAAAAADTAVLYMAAAKAPEIKEDLLKEGMDPATPGRRRGIGLPCRAESVRRRPRGPPVPGGAMHRRARAAAHRRSSEKTVGSSAPDSELSPKDRGLTPNLAVLALDLGKRRVIGL